MEAATNPFNDYVFIDATPSEKGAFTLATEKALAKLEKFQLPDPTHFILQWIQALIASGAQQIDISYGTTSLRGQFNLLINFDGPGYTRFEVDALYDHVFRSGRDRSVDRLRELALGWLSACSLQVDKMILDSNGRRRVRERSGRSVQETTSSSPTPDTETEQPEQAAPIHQLFISGKGDYPFESILSRRCCEVPASIYFNKSLITGSSGPSGVPWPNRSFRCGPTQGVMGATYGGSATSNVSFLRYGVEFVARPEASLQPPVIIRVSDPTLSKNVSQTDVVRDDAYEDFLGRIRTEMKSMGLQLTTKRIPGYQRESLNRFIQSYLVSYVDVRVFDDPHRLQLMGPEFKNLIEFPLFNAAGGSYKSLADLRTEYLLKGYLLYSVDNRAQLARWQGMLLVLEPEEVVVLKKYFSNLHPLGWDEVRTLCQGGMREKLAAARRRPVACQVAHQLSIGLKSTTTSLKLMVQVIVPDVYPTGRTVVAKTGELVGTTLPGADVTLIIETGKGAITSTNDLANLKRSLNKPIRRLVQMLSSKLNSPDISNDQSRMRYAELCCELLIYLIKNEAAGPAVLDELGKTVTSSPLIGIEDGNLVSIDDLRSYLKIVGQVYLGGAFLEGLESGALDPMPRAQQLLDELLQPSQIVPTESVREQLTKDPELKFQFRRQTVMKDLAKNAYPERALKAFANEAAAEAREMARLEREYKEALEGAKLFVQPDQARLSALSRAIEDDEFVPFHLETATKDANVPEDQNGPSSPSSAVPTHSLPSLEQDLKALRASLGDFCSAPGAIHVERHESSFTLHLSTKWVEGGEGLVQILCQGHRPLTVKHRLPLEGFIRLVPASPPNHQVLLDEAVEQLILKALHTHRAEPKQRHQRHRLRRWLLKCCEALPTWRVTNSNIATELVDQPLVPCLGGRVLSWRQLKAQAKRLGHTPVVDPTCREQVPDPVCDVIALREPWRDQLLQELGFPRSAVWKRVTREKNFDVMIRSAWREIITVASGTEDNLMRQDIIGKLSGDSSFWTKWRSGFLSWDASGERALVNPNHKLGKKLLERFQPDDSWAAILASALFSTINRGLQEVEDHHEKAFLQGLLDTID
jgi:hypothetical protein